MGIFRKWVGVFNFCETLSKFLIGLSPICCLCICVDPLWQFEHVLRHISLCSCIFHHLWTLLHDRCLSKCPRDILVLNWTQVSSNNRILSWLIMLTMFWSLSFCFTHFAHVAHTLGTPHASHAAHTCISTCSAQTHTCTCTYFMHCVYAYLV